MGEPNWANRTLFHCDNLEVLRGMNSETVDLIATDPPFKKGRDFHATPDSLAAGAKFQDRWSWQRDVHDAWVDQITDDEPDVMNVINGSRRSYGDDMGAFLCFMGVRLLAMRRVLKDTGSIYLHCDPTASHYLKALMDAIFGRKNFRNEIIWCYAGGGIPRNDFPRKHHNILRYSKSKVVTYNPVYRPYTPGTVQRGRTPVKGKYFEKGLRKEGTPVNDWWTDCPKITSPTDPEKTGYPTQKPLSLYERIISVSSNEGDVVLDPFCGCATTPIAAERLGRRWVGIDIWDEAHKVVIDRLEDEGLVGPNGSTDRLMTFGDVTYTTEPPERTDAGDVAAPYLPVRNQRPTEAWQRLSHKEIVEHLAEAQGDVEGVICGGCGRKLEREFMQLDHIQPRAGRGANDITNRILLCQPCNGRKKQDLTLPGLIRANKRAGWMRDEGLARIAQENAAARAERVRDEMS